MLVSLLDEKWLKTEKKGNIQHQIKTKQCPMGIEEMSGRNGSDGGLDCVNWLKPTWFFFCNQNMTWNDWDRIKIEIS